LAGNLRVTGIDHPYWTSRAGNAVRFALWHERRRHAAPYLRAIAGAFGETAAASLREAAGEFEKETALLGELTALLPPGGDEKAHWEEKNIARAEELLAGAGAHYAAGVDALQRVADVDFAAFATRDADALRKLVADRNQLVSEEALAALVALAPDDLDARLAALFDSEPDERKEMGDGPIHRQILFALAGIDSEAATDAIGRAVFFEGRCDAVPTAVSRWAAQLYWTRKGAAGRALFLRALDSKTPHVVDQGLEYLGRCGDPADLARLKGFPRPAAYAARILLGDDAAYADLVAGLRTDGWYDAYSRLRALGPRIEPHVLPYLESDDPRVVHYVAILLSRVGTEKSLEPLERAVAKYPSAQRLRQALEDLRGRL